MAKTTPGALSIPVPVGLPVNEAAGTINSADALNGTRIPYVHLRDENNNDRLVSPDGVVTNTVNTGLIAITTAASQVRPLIANRITLVVRNVGAADCWLGVTNGVIAGNVVGTGTGLWLRQNESMDIKFTGTIYAICLASTATVIGYWEEVS